MSILQKYLCNLQLLCLGAENTTLYKADETATCTAQRENMANFLIWRLCRIKFQQYWTLWIKSAGYSTVCDYELQETYLHTPQRM